jgi:hypothetical protein
MGDVEGGGGGGAWKMRGGKQGGNAGDNTLSCFSLGFS